MFENVSIMRSSESPQNWPRNDDDGDDDDFENHEPKHAAFRNCGEESETTYGEINGMAESADTEIVAEEGERSSISIRSH